MAIPVAPFLRVRFIFDSLAFFAHGQWRSRHRLRSLRVDERIEGVDAKIEGVRVVKFGLIDVELSVPRLPQLWFQAVSRNLDGIFSENSSAPFWLPLPLMR